jgi:taurine dioxygenase
MKRMLAELTALHKVDASQYEEALREKVTFRRGSAGATQQEPETKEISATHPVIRTHPETGRKALFVNSGSTRVINGLPKAESDAILSLLFDHVRTPEFQVRFQWQENSVVIWDNRCTQHYAVADYWPEKRVMYRATIADDSRPTC